MKVLTHRAAASGLALLLVLGLPRGGRAVQTGLGAGEAERVERLAALGKVWAAAKFFHPYLAYRDIDWDAAAVAAIPKAGAARDAGEYAAAVQTMLDALGDPATR